MGDTMEETEPLPTRLNKPQTLDVDVLTENTSSSVATVDDCKLLVTRESTETETETENGARLVRNRTRTFTETRDCRDHSSDGLITTSSSDGQLGSGKCTEDTVCNNDLTRRESFNSGDTSPSTTNNFAKNLFSRSMRYSSSGCATTTKKCVLTLDGYSYVIVASQPESFVKRSEEPTGTTSSVTSSTAVSNTSTSSSGATNSVACGNAVSGNVATSTYAASITTSAGTGGAATAQGQVQGQGVTTESATNSPNSNCKANPTFYTGLTNTGSSATINGQVATHGSLTIVRRSNSRKNFGQVDGQQHASGTTPLTPTSATIPAGLTNLQQQQQQQPQQTSNSNLSDGIASGINTQDNHLKTTRIYQGTTTTTTITTSAIATNPDKDSVETQEVTQREEIGIKNTNKQENNQSNMEQIQPINPPTTQDPCMHPASPNDQVPLVPAPFDNCADVENTDNIIELGIDNLPAVDTPDACDKAALRLRCILKKISRGDVNNDILRTNLHYAARVLEAVFNEEANKAVRYNGSCNCKHRNCRQSTAEDSIDSRTKGVTSAPQTHSGPTGPPNPTDDNNTTTTSSATTTTTTSSSSSSHSNKPTIQRQRRLLTPVWARSMSRSISTNKTRLADEDDELSEVQPDAVPLEVREWLASTFTRQLATTRRSNDEKPKFRSVAHAIRAGIFVDRIYRRVSSTSLMQFPPEVVKVLKNINDWSFNVFQLAEVSNNQPIKYLCYDLFNRYGLTHKYKIAPATMETFLHRIEEGYCRYRNPYHNNLHGADVTQAVHFILCQLGVMNWLTDLEIFASLFAALIHDYEHTGTTNNFHVMTGSDTALLYNDRCVLENHHVSAAFRLLKDDDANILSHLSREEFRELRTLIIEMVLATDMSGHFQQLKNMRNLLSLNETTIEKSKALSMVLHCCDISHPAKAWNIHHRWTMLLLEEFFRQGDLESQMGLPFSPLCDRKTTHIPESQIGFIDFIVDPSMALLGEMLEQILAPLAPMIKNSNQTQSQSVDIADDQTQAQASPSKLRSSMRQTVETIQESSTDESGSRKSASKKFTVQKPWMDFMAENKMNWKVLADKEQKERDAAEQKEREMAGAEEKHDDDDEKEVEVEKGVDEEKSDEKANKDQEPETETKTETETKEETTAEE